MVEKVQGLNPCFNGRYSTRIMKEKNGKIYMVLILVLMEDTLRDFILLGLAGGLLVLILVLMEDTLRALQSCQSINHHGS